MWFMLMAQQAQMNMTQMIQGQICATADEFSYLKGFKKSADIRKMLFNLKKQN